MPHISPNSLTRILSLSLFSLLLSGCKQQYYMVSDKRVGPTITTEKMYKERIEKLQKEIRKDPDNPDNYIRLGKLYAYKKSYEKACMNIEKALTIAPDRLDTLRADPNFRYWAVFYNAGLMHCEHKEYYLSLKRLKRSLDFEEENPHSMNVIGLCYGGLEKFDKAAFYFQKATAVAPDEIDPYLNYAKTLEEQHEIQRAEEVLQEARKIVDDPEWFSAQDEWETKRKQRSALEVHLALGENLVKQGKNEDAILEFSQVIALDEHYCDAYTKRAQCHKALGNVNEAIQDSINGEECSNRKRI
jgi:tetratricopeptide (TPR) repeat protein